MVSALFSKVIRSIVATLPDAVAAIHEQLNAPSPPLAALVSSWHCNNEVYPSKCIVSIIYFFLEATDCCALSYMPAGLGHELCHAQFISPLPSALSEVLGLLHDV